MTDKSGKPRDPTDTSHPDYERTEDPTDPFYGDEKTEGEPKAEPSEDEYKVGPGFPPKETQWKPGCTSPNKKGRPKKVASMKPDLKKALEAALNEKVVVTKNNKEIVLTRATLGIEQLVTQFAKGNKDARRDVFKYAAELGVDLQAKEVIAQALENDHKAIVEAALLRRQQNPSPEPAPNDHVKAPPDLIDDDVTEPASDETPGTSPQRDRPAKKPDEPVLDDEGRPLPASDPRYVREMARRRLAQQRKDQGES
jgi:Family of unknown function (DUF5681)